MAESHGHSVAAWTGTGIILLGVLIGCISAVMGSLPGLIVGVVICVGGSIAWVALNKAGKGDPHSMYANDN